MSERHYAMPSTLSGYVPAHAPSQSQQGASVTGVVFFIFALGIFAMLGIAIIPAQITDYQLTKSIANELKKSNDNKESAGQFMENLQKQLSINADYTSKPEDILTFTSKQTGSLAVHKKYEVVNNFMGNVFIVNRFEGDITASEALD